MQPIIRRDDYINEYLNLTHNVYNKSHNVYFVTYYQLDKNASVYDSHYKAPYEIVGGKSGLKWNKILHFPIFSAEPIQPALDSSEKGINKESSSSSTAMISPETKIIPRSGDKFITSINGDLSVFDVTGVTLSANFDFRNAYTRISYIYSDDSIHDLEKQLVGTYMYVEPFHIILPIDIAEYTIQLLVKLQNSKTILYKNYFNRHLNTYVSNNIIDRDLLYYLHDIISHIKVIFSNYTYELQFHDIHEQSVYKLLFDESFNQTTYITTYRENEEITITNPLRANYTRSIREVYVDSGGSENILSLYYEDITDIIVALNHLLEYRMTGNTNYNEISFHPKLSAMIRMYLMLKLNENRFRQVVSDVINHIPDSCDNLLEIAYKIFLSNMIYNQLIQYEAEFV